MKTRFGIAAAAGGMLAVASFGVHAESQLGVVVAGLADDESGRSSDLDLRFVPGPSWTVEAGVGSTKARSDIADIDGKSLRAALDLHSDRFGLRGYYRSYSDSNNFETDTIGARASLRSGGFGFSVIAETRGFDVTYTSGSPLNPTEGTVSFDGNGYGAGASYGAAGWAFYAEALFYDFGSKLDDYETVAGGPGILGIPLVQGLSGSFVTFKQGALDHQLAAGIERGFDRSSIRFDWAGVEDAISGAKSNSFSAGYRHSFTRRMALGLTVGMTDSDFGSVNFAGASFEFSL